jgi:hypothetical protein
MIPGWVDNSLIVERHRFIGDFPLALLLSTWQGSSRVIVCLMGGGIPDCYYVGCTIDNVLPYVAGAGVQPYSAG